MSTEAIFKPPSAVLPRRATETDGAAVDIFDLATDEETLKELLRDLFENHWHEIIFGPIIQGAAYELRPPRRPPISVCSMVILRLLSGYRIFIFASVRTGMRRRNLRGAAGPRAPNFTGASIAQAHRCPGACVCSMVRVNSRSPCCCQILF